MIRADTHLAIEHVGVPGRSQRVWRATYDGVTICANPTRSGAQAGSEYLMQNLPPETWRALVRRPAP